MRRRRVIAILAGGALGRSSAGRAQQPPRMFRIGILADGPLQEMEGLREGLRQKSLTFKVRTSAMSMA